jgi:sporulation protein YlmC with PRC-barrel domain
MRYLKMCVPGAVVMALAIYAVAVQSADPPRGSVSGMPVMRASQITGMNIKNPGGQDLGKVEDVVVDMGTGNVRYAAVSFGGFLGVGDKLFAVPFHALKVKQNIADKSHHFEMNIDKETLEKAKGFDKKNWPDFANPRFGEENDRFFLNVTARS